MSIESAKTRSPWLSSYAEGVPAHIDYQQYCLPQLLDQTVHRFPDNLALLFQGYSMTWVQVQEMVTRFAGALTELGVRKGDRVSILLPNTIPCVVAYYATLKIGAIAVMNCPLYSDRELLHQFNDSESVILVTLDLLSNRMIDLRPQTQIKHIIYTSIGDYLPFPQNWLFPLVAKRKRLAAEVRPATGVYKWEELLDIVSTEPPEVELSFTDAAMYQYTGGTTGKAKGAILTHGNLSRQVQQVAAWFPQFAHGEGRMLGALPFFHVFGLTTSLNLSVFMGWTNILIPKPDPKNLLKAIAKFRPTFGPMVPTMYIGIMNHPLFEKTDLTCFKGFFSGSAPLPTEVIRKFEELTGAVIVEGYGLTESSPVTHINPFGAVRKAGSIGIPLPDTECKLADAAPVNVDEPHLVCGELLVKGPQVMEGYLHLPEQTAATLDDGWLSTGDIATMDEDGYFYIVDRLKDMIISGGFNVFPREIDEVLFTHPDIEEASSVGIPHPTRGEQIRSYVVLKQGATSTEEEIIRFCRDRLAVYKLPTEIEFLSELPKTIVGKVLKRELRKRTTPEEDSPPE